MAPNTRTTRERKRAGQRVGFDDIGFKGDEDHISRSISRNGQK